MTIYIALNMPYLNIIFNGQVKSFANYRRANEDWHIYEAGTESVEPEGPKSPK